MLMEEALRRAANNLPNQDRGNRGVTQLTRQTRETAPEIEGIDVYFVKRGTTVAPVQPDEHRPDIVRPIAAPSDTTPPSPPDRLHPGQPVSVRPCIGGPI